MALPDPILTALDGQVNCYRRLLKLAEQQHDLVQQEQIEPLLGVLKLRQEELDRISAFERSLAAAKKQWPQYLAKLLPLTRKRAESLLAETRKLLEQITEADKNDVLLLQQRKMNVGRQIGQATAGKTVNRAYAVNAYGKTPARLNVQT